jgi:hypothetical protein
LHGWIRHIWKGYCQAHHGKTLVDCSIGLIFELQSIIFGLFAKVNDIFSPLVANTVKQQFNNENRKQIIIELLGVIFKRSYLADYKDNPKTIVIIIIFSYDIV